ncbi:MAG: sigma-70 family RNA polymerase sigma factor [Hyphomicrobiales bacterium]
MNNSGGEDGRAVAGWRLAADAELLAAAARRDKAAFAEIASRYYRPVYRLAWRMTGGHADSEDIAQEAFVKLWRDPGQLREAAALKGWLMRVAANGAIDRARRRQTTPLDEAPEPSDARPRADRSLERKEAQRRIDRAIAALPQRQRLTLSLVHFEGLSNIEAAAAMDTSVEAVESLLARARRGLKERLSGQWRELLDALGADGG